MISRSLLAILALALVAPAAPAEQETDAAAIAAASAAFSTAYCAGDTLGMAALYVEDAVLLAPDREIHGAAAIARYFAPRKGREGLSHAMTPTSLEISGDLAADQGTWHYTWRMSDGIEHSASGPYLLVWQRGDDGQWRKLHDTWHRPPRKKKP